LSGQFHAPALRIGSVLTAAAPSRRLPHLCFSGTLLSRAHPLPRRTVRFHASAVKRGSLHFHAAAMRIVPSPCPCRALQHISSALLFPAMQLLRPAKLFFSVPFPFISTSRLAYAPLYWSWPLHHGSIPRFSVSAHCMSGPTCANASQCHSGALPCVPMPLPGPARQLSTLPLHFPARLSRTVPQLRHPRFSISVQINEIHLWAIPSLCFSICASPRQIPSEQFPANPMPSSFIPCHSFPLQRRSAPCRSVSGLSSAVTRRSLPGFRR
jgi:hypothetical protein